MWAMTVKECKTVRVKWSRPHSSGWPSSCSAKHLLWLLAGWQDSDKCSTLVLQPFIQETSSTVGTINTSAVKRECVCVFMQNVGHLSKGIQGKRRWGSSMSSCAVRWRLLTQWTAYDLMDWMDSIQHMLSWPSGGESMLILTVYISQCIFFI